MARRRTRDIAWIRILVPTAVAVSLGLAYVAYRLGEANAAEITIDFLLGQITLATWQALGVAFLVGAGLVYLYSLYQMARSGLLHRRYRKELAGLETEVHQLRNLPLAPGERVVDAGDTDFAGSFDGEREEKGAAGS